MNLAVPQGNNSCLTSLRCIPIVQGKNRRCRLSEKDVLSYGIALDVAAVMAVNHGDGVPEGSVAAMVVGRVGHLIDVVVVGMGFLPSGGCGRTFKPISSNTGDFPTDICL